LWSSFLKCPSTSCVFPISEDKELAANLIHQPQTSAICHLHFYEVGISKGHYLGATI
jgi:hypothetical protein